MKNYIALAAIALAACTNGLAEADVTTDNTVTFPGASSAALSGLPASALEAAAATPVTSDGVITVDVQSELDAMAKLGPLTATISKDSLSGNSLALLQHIKGTIETADGVMPAELLADLDVPAHSTEVDLPLLISDAKLLDFLKAGKVLIHFYVTGTISTAPVSLAHKLVAHVDVAIEKSVLKL